MIDLLPGHPDLKAQEELKKQVAAEQELQLQIEAYKLANRSKKKRLYEEYVQLRTKFPNPRDRTALRGYKHKRPPINKELIEVIFYRKHNSFYSRFIGRRYMGLKVMWQTIQTFNKPFIIMDSVTKTDITEEFYIKLLAQRVESELKSMEISKLKTLLAATCLTISTQSSGV